MIYSVLKGGLGNMMFEIAAMHSLAIDNNDTAAFINIPSQITYLNNETNFNPSLNHAQEYMFLLERFNHPGLATYTAQFNVPYHYEKLQYVNNAYYDGFFQSEKWFAHNRTAVLDILKPSQSVTDHIMLKYSHLLNDNTVAVHVRRGDYVKNQGNHAVLPLSYYEKAFGHFDKNSLFVFFSDDIEYCKQTFKMANQVFIENEKDYVEIFLISQMKHCITANSSFSWWGGWLNQNVNKIVIGPSLWFGPNIRHNTNDVIPESWVKV
jgi:hypothetical protein